MQPLWTPNEKTVCSGYDFPLSQGSFVNVERSVSETGRKEQYLLQIYDLILATSLVGTLKTKVGNLFQCVVGS